MTTDTIDSPAAALSEYKTEPSYRLPLEQIRPSPYNPRKRFDEAALAELADSIAAHGVQQAIVVRNVTPAKPGGAPFEIVAGERRWRASNVLVKRGGHAAPHTIPAFIRELDDFEAREIALTENSHRNDLHPLEEAQAYEQLLLKPVGGGEFKPPRVKGYTVEQLAEKIGHKPNFVFGRLKLLDLAPEAREAFLADTLKLKVAEQLARMPAKEQERALPVMLAGWGGEPFSHRQATKYLHDHFMLKLGKAIFPIEDATLVPKAGACTDCQKRSGASPDLFEGIGVDDMCLDSACHSAKVKALGDRQVDRARAAGQTVLIGPAAKKVLGSHTTTSDYALRKTGHVDLDKPLEELTGNRKSLRKLLGDDFDKAIVVKGEHDDQPSLVATQADVKAALKAKGLLVPSTKSKPGTPGKKISAEDIKKQRAERIDTMLGKRVHAALAKQLESDGAEGFPSDSEAWIRWMAEHVFEATDANLDEVEAALTGGKITGRLIDAVAGEKLVRALIMMVIGSAIADEYISYRNEAGDPAAANKLATEIGFDLAAFRTEIADEVDGAIRDEIQALADVVAPAAKKITASTKVAKGSASVKYRDPATGATWSGRGLQPKWLKVALASGKTLATFDASTPTFNAAAQGSPSPTAKDKKGELTPEKALADAVAKEAGVDLAKLTAKPATKVARKATPAKASTPKTNQKDETAKPPATAEATFPITDKGKGAWPFPTSASKAAEAQS